VNDGGTFSLSIIFLHTRAQDNAIQITDQRQSGALTLRIGHIHMLKIRLVLLLDPMSTCTLIVITPLILSFGLSFSFLFSLSLSLSLSLILSLSRRTRKAPLYNTNLFRSSNCLKSRTEIQARDRTIESARSLFFLFQNTEKIASFRFLFFDPLFLLIKAIHC